MMRSAGARGHPAYWAFVLHRVSGLALALFLPVHLYVLALAIDDAARLDAFLVWTEAPPVTLAEGGLVVLLAAHLAGGLRLLALEFLPWREGQKARIAVGAGFALAAGLLFLLNAI
jgi:fumarate reductase subunit D